MLTLSRLTQTHMDLGAMPRVPMVRKRPVVEEHCIQDMPESLPEHFATE